MNTIELWSDKEQAEADNFRKLPLDKQATRFRQKLNTYPPEHPQRIEGEKQYKKLFEKDKKCV